MAKTSKAPPPKPVARKQGEKKERIKRDPNSKTSRQIAARTEENLSTKQRQRADAFVMQYLRDFNATQAFIRLKHDEDPYSEVDYNYAMNQGYQMTRWPYIAQRIQEAMAEAEEKNVVTRNEILWGLKKEALYHGVGASHSARVGGWGKLATIMGMDQKQVERGLGMRGGVMIVPQIQDLDDWEARAQAAQAALKEEVRQ